MIDGWEHGAIVLVLLLSWARPTAAGAADEIVWQWFGGCPAAQQMRVEVQLNGSALYSNSFPVCTMPRAQVPDDSPQKELQFWFRGPAALFGAEFERLGTVKIEGNIWRAGGETDALLLGLSFATPDQVLLNSVHVATARRPAQSTMAKGLVIHTSAVRSQPGGRAR